MPWVDISFLEIAAIQIFNAPRPNEESLKPIPKIVIVLTDGYSPWPETIDSHIEKLIICCSVTGSVGNVPEFTAAIDMTRL